MQGNRKSAVFIHLSSAPYETGSLNVLSNSRTLCNVRMYCYTGDILLLVEKYCRLKLDSNYPVTIICILMRKVPVWV